jgi:hypothetical protein
VKIRTPRKKQANPDEMKFYETKPTKKGEEKNQKKENGGLIW